MLENNNLEKLEELARLKIEKNREKFYQDFEKIISYFSELEKIDTSKIEIEDEIKQSFNFNVFQEENKRDWFNDNLLIEQFKDRKDDFLKLPNVFD